MTDEPTAAPDLFTGPEAVAWLQAEGWKVSRSKFYSDADAGKIGRAKGGKFTLAALDAYTLHCKRQDGDNPRTRNDRLLRERAEAELVKAKAEAQRLVLRLENERGNLLDRESVEEQWAAAFQLLKTSFETWAHEAADPIIELVRGDADRQPELLRYLLETTEDYFAQFAEEREWVVELEEEAP